MAMLALRSSASDALKGYAHLELGAVALQPHLVTAANTISCAWGYETPYILLTIRPTPNANTGNAHAHGQPR